MGDLELQAVLDSGASDNFLRADLLPQDARLDPRQELCHFADGTSALSVGVAQLEVALQGRKVTLEITVMERLHEPMLLGLAFMVGQEVAVDFKNCVLHYGLQERFSVSLLTDRPQLRHTLASRECPAVSENFPSEYKERLRTLLATHQEVFLPPGGVLPQTRHVKHVIKLKSEQPFRLAPYRYSERKRQEIALQVQEMLAMGIIIPCVSAYCSPIVMAPKKDGQYRFCVDYRKLNTLTEDATQPIPRISDSLRDLGNATIFSTLDLKSGYWQIPMDPDSVKYTAFATPSGGTYAFKAMPFGLKGAPGTFQRLMAQEVLVNYIGDFCTVYLDDIIIYSTNWDDHLRHLGLVLERLAAHQLTCAPGKCVLGSHQLEYLGFLVKASGNEAKTSYCRSIVEHPEPTSKKQLQGFIGTCNWLHEYVKDLARWMAPLTDLLRGKRSFHWTAAARAAFENIKNLFRKPLKLARPQPGRPIILQTDASAAGMGAVLYYDREDGGRDVISFASAKFTPAESRYHCNEQECAAVIWAIKRFRPYLEDQPFTLRTDSRALTWLDRLKDSRDKLRRWALLLQEFTFRVEHVPGRYNELPDALSRNPEEQTHVELDDVDRMLPPKVNLREDAEVPLTAYRVTKVAPLAEEIRLAQQADPVLSDIAQRALRGHTSLDNGYTVMQGMLWQWEESGQRWTPVVPASAMPRLLYEYHDSPLANHPGAEETLRAIREHFRWPGMKRDVEEHVRLCHLCACVKKDTSRKPGLRPHQPTEPWRTISVDLMGPYPITARRKRYILVVTDLFSRWVEAFALVSSEAPFLVQKVEDEVFSRWGYPEHVLCDNGPQFTSREWAAACERWQADLWTTPIYHPRANPTERRNQGIKIGLKLHLEGKRHSGWDLHLPEILFSLRYRRNAATGVSPAWLLFGQNIKLPGAWQLQARDPPAPLLKQRICQAAEKQKKYQQRYAEDSCEHREFQQGDPVYIKHHSLSSAANRVHAGFDPSWEGPYQVLRRAGDTVYIVDRAGVEVKLHLSEMKPAPKPSVTHRQVVTSTRSDDFEPTSKDFSNPSLSPDLAKRFGAKQDVSSLRVPDGTPLLHEPANVSQTTSTMEALPGPPPVPLPGAPPRPSLDSREGPQEAQGRRPRGRPPGVKNRPEVPTIDTEDRRLASQRYNLRPRAVRWILT